MKVLVGCEFSGIVRDAFIARGHEAMSCDFLDTERPGPHYKGNVFDVIDFPWDLGIFHFPCTGSAVSGARHFAAKKMDGRFYAGASLFMRGWKAAAHIPRVAFEHPVSVISSLFRKPDQIIQPHDFGHGETKAICLWLRELPKLTPTNKVEGRVARVHRAPPHPSTAGRTAAGSSLAWPMPSLNSGGGSIRGPSHDRRLRYESRGYAYARDGCGAV